MIAGAVVNILVLAGLAALFGGLLWRIYRRMRVDATQPARRGEEVDVPRDPEGPSSPSA
ncbi:MAG: hypothetical protein AB1778_04200 [Candidatus Bipolaricaulota bacterium]